MIDYDKLKITHKLAEKYHNQSGDSIVIEHNCWFGCYVNVPCQFIINQEPTTFNSINDLIMKLEELTQSDKPKPKYEIGQEVWFVRGNYTDFKPEKSFVRRFQDGYINFFDRDGTVYKILVNQAFPSREALIDSQIDYWNKLKYPTIQESTDRARDNIKELGRKIFSNDCQHESDGTTHTFHQDGESGRLTMSKCKKCGEFYK